MPLSGTTAIRNNTLRRCGSLQRGWNSGNGAIWAFALDYNVNATVQITGNRVLDSPYVGTHL